MTHVSINAPHGQKGYSLVELLITVGIIALLIVVAFGVKRVLDNDAAVQGTIQGVTAIASNVKQVYGSSNSGYGSVIETDIINANLAPSSFLKGTALEAPIGKDTVFVRPASAGREFYVALLGAKIDADACVKAVSALQGSANIIVVGSYADVTEVEAVVGNDTTAGTLPADTTVIKSNGNYNAGNAIAQCGDVDGDGENDIVFTFR